MHFMQVCNVTITPIRSLNVLVLFDGVGCRYLSNVSVPYDKHLRYRPLFTVYDVARLEAQCEPTFIVLLCSFRTSSSGT
jgi:hypothetical protein